MEERFLLEEINGSHQQKLFKSSFNVVYVQFRADWYGKGFNATYTSVDRKCLIILIYPAMFKLSLRYKFEFFTQHKTKVNILHQKYDYLLEYQW